jgi:hypothetical protein
MIVVLTIPVSCSTRYRVTAAPRPLRMSWRALAREPTITRPGPQGCPCWQCVGYAHQSGSCTSIQRLEHGIDDVPLARARLARQRSRHMRAQRKRFPYLGKVAWLAQTWRT